MLTALLAVLLLQAPESPPELKAEHCGGSGWCTLGPIPLMPERASATGDTLVANGKGSGILSLWWNGAWRDTLDTGLGAMRRLRLVESRRGQVQLFACDAERCLQAEVKAGRMGALSRVPEESVPPEPVAEQPVTDKSGALQVFSPRPGVRFFFEDGTFGVEVKGQRQKHPAVSKARFTGKFQEVFGGGRGEPLWLTVGGHVLRLTTTEAQPLGVIDQPAFPRVQPCLRVSMRGDPHRPFALCHGFDVETLSRFDGERWQVLSSPFMNGRTQPLVAVGEGCAPCIVLPDAFRWRTKAGRWRTLRPPAPPPEARSLHRFLRAGIDASGRPHFTSQLGEYRHTGQTWRRVGEGLPEDDSPPPEHPPCNATGCLKKEGNTLSWRPMESDTWRPLSLPPALLGPRPDGGEADCLGALADGEFAFVFGALLVRGTPARGWRTERLPASVWDCGFEEGPETLYLYSQSGSYFFTQEKDSAPRVVPEGTWARVTGVTADDVLRVREVPDWRALEVGALSSAACVREVRRRTVPSKEVWAEVDTADGQRGWVNQRYLSAADSTCAPPASGGD